MQNKHLLIMMLAMAFALTPVIALSFQMQTCSNPWTRGGALVAAIPNGNVDSCNACHYGGYYDDPPTNPPFRVDFWQNGNSWDAVLAVIDSDGDGYTNGEELQDPLGNWSQGDPNPGDPALVSNPANPNSTPPLIDTPSPTPTDTSIPLPTDTMTPMPTDTSVPQPTDTMTPMPTETPMPTSTPNYCYQERSFQIGIGWTLIGFGDAPDGLTNANELAEAMVAQGIDVSNVADWSGNTWIVYQLGLPFSNFPIEDDKGYFIRSNSSGTFNYSVNYIGPGAFDPNYATSDNFFTLMTSPVLGTSPHAESQIWYSMNILRLIDLDSFTVPIGTTTIKEFDNDGTPGLDGRVVMVKQMPGYDPANNDWYYELRDPSNNVLNSGAIGTCINCHVGWSDTDYLAGTEIRNMGPGAYAADYATSSDFFTLMSGPVSGTSPHGETQIWYSSNIENILKYQDRFTVPEGTTSIKEFNNDGVPGLEGRVVMIKQPAGYDSDNGDWYYEMQDMSGSVLNSGRIPTCISCHSGWTATDYLAGTELR